MGERIILETRNLRKEYPGVVALNNLSIQFQEGEVHAIVGENGAGKSTMIKSIAGAIKPTAGTIVINGKEYSSMTPQKAREEGIEVIYQEFNLVPKMSCADNIFLNTKTGSGIVVNDAQRQKMAKELFESLGVDLDPQRLIGTCSPAYQQIVEICKAVSKNVKILFMDEPSAPLTVNEIEMLFRIVRKLKADGVTIIYISHRLEEIFEICDRVSVMRDGSYITTVQTKDTSRQQLIDLMVGREMKEQYPTRQSAQGEEILRLEHVTGNGDTDISFTLHRGEILGFAGLVGAGRTELMNVIYGANKLESGQVYIKNQPVKINSPTQAIAHGIGLIPEDRKNTGAFLKFSISWNTTIMALRKFCNRGIVINDRKINETTEEYVRSLKIKTPSIAQKVANLSGGNQQKVVLAKAMAAETDILIFDEPTRGIDVGAKQEIYQLMNDLVEQGKAILMVSSDMPELLGMADNLVVLCEGKQAGYLTKAEFDSSKILDLASGNR